MLDGKIPMIIRKVRLMSNGINRDFFVIDILEMHPKEINNQLGMYSGLVNVTPIGNTMLLIEKIPDKVSSSISPSLSPRIGGSL